MAGIGDIFEGITTGYKTGTAIRDRRAEMDLNRTIALANIAEAGRRTGISERQISLQELVHKDAEARAKQEYTDKLNKEKRKGELIAQFQEAETDLETFNDYFELSRKALALEENNDPKARDEYHELFASVNSRIEQDGMQLTLHGNFRPIPSMVDQETGEMTPISMSQLKQAQHEAEAERALAEKELAILDPVAFDAITKRQKIDAKAVMPSELFNVAKFDKGIIKVFKDGKTIEVAAPQGFLDSGESGAPRTMTVKINGDDVGVVVWRDADGSMKAVPAKDLIDPKYLPVEKTDQEVMQPAATKEEINTLQTKMKKITDNIAEALKKQK